MSVLVLALLGLAGFGAGFVDAIAGGGGLLTLPSLALAGLDPVAAVATNKLASTFGSGSATLAFWRGGKIEAAMAPSALAAGAGAALGALALPWAPRALLAQALPIVLIAVALYFAVAPNLSEAQRHARLRPGLFASTLAPAVGFYDGVFGPGAGSFYMIGFVVLAGFGLTRAMAGSRFANFGSNFGSLLIYALSGQILVPAGLAMAVGAFLGARLGAHAALRHGARVVRPLIVVVSCAMALKLMSAPGGLFATAWKLATGG
ncbi:MAG TPA: TSUP family transporter [Roseiarcus sp.]|nr:TSUP family transporter [Roseiarcus sp.]